MAHTSYVFTLTFLLWVSFSAQETFLLMKSFLRYFYIVFKEQFFLFPQAFPEVWWRWGESNSWPPACKAGALPAELHPHISTFRLMQGPRNLSFSFPRLKVHNLSIAPSKLNNDLRLCSLWLTLGYEELFILQVSLERRWSSRTFRYGYLVTTSP